MKKLFLSAAVVATTVFGAGVAVAGDGVCNNNCQDNGNKNGWASHTDANGGNERDVPRGLIISGDNGRVDNGQGNGGENLEAPNNCGETKCNGEDDNDPN